MIIITTQCFFPNIGGIESLMTGMAEAMSNAGKDVLVLADGKKTLNDKSKKYKIKRFNGWKPYRRRRKAIYLKKFLILEIFLAIELLDNFLRLSSKRNPLIEFCVGFIKSS